MILEVMNQRPTIIDFHVDQNRDRLGTIVDLVANYPYRITEREIHEDDATYWDPVTSYSPSKQILSQPWGTDLLRSEFASPASSHWSDKLYWVGSWWKNESWGNYPEIFELKKHTEIAGIKFVQLNNCTTAQNRFFVRNSRIGPHIGGAGQARRNYLACRFFKNISYGQFSITNIKKAQELLQGSAIHDSSVSIAIERGLEVNPDQARDLVLFQQSCIRNYTVSAHLYLIFFAATELMLS
jgi:hypothetical protein